MRALLVEDSSADARLIRELLAEDNVSSIEFVHVARLSDALRAIKKETFDAVLLDLGLPDARGLEALTRIGEFAPDVPVVVFSGHRDEAIAVEAVRNGAQDYLLKDRTDGVRLARALQYAIERKRAELQIHHMAYYDGLTDLPNHRLFQDRLNQALARTRRDKKTLAVLFLDIDDFKTINDTLGHAAADHILQGVASRLSTCVRDSDTVARLGGDEFTLVLPELSHLEDVPRLVAKVQWALQRPFHVAGCQQYVTASIGISLCPDDGDTAEALLRNADAAMYQAKRKGKGRCHYHSGAIEVRVADRLSLLSELRCALEANEFVLHYQPRVDVREGRVLAVEALLRWRHPTLGLLPPYRFVPQAEETGLIVPIGRWVLHEACAQAVKWNASFPDHRIRVSVNLSAREFSHRDLPRMVDAALNASGIPAGELELELTESGILRDTEIATASLRRLKERGVRLSIDDFGTGYSSLSRLRRFPIDALKIDRSFVGNLTSDAGDAAIVNGIITMGHGMHVTVVAEGVETAEQVAGLSALGCDEMQGFYFSPPCPVESLAGILSGPPRWAMG